MAKMFPRDLTQYTPTDSERIVFYELKQQLPDSFNVFYSIKWSAYENGHLVKSEADFIVESPDHGFLCLEVKGGDGVHIDGDTWYLEDHINGDRKLKESPYDQAEKSMYYFRNYFSGRYNTAYRGIFGAGVVFPFYAIGEGVNLSERQKDLTIDCEDMNTLYSRIKRLFRLWSGASYGRRYYSKSQHEAFLELIWERIAIGAAAGALVQYKENQLSVINRVQDNYVFFLKNVRQFYIRGGAGTGKTWIAMKMAIDEAENDGKKVLFLCQSPQLANYVREIIGSTVTVLDIRLLFEQIVNDSNSLDGPLYHGVSEKIKPGINVYDAVFIDEAQDFTAEWAAVARMLLRDPDESRLGIFYDDVQILREESFGNGFGISGRPYLLRENIRNTANIYNWASEKTRLGRDVISNPIEGPTPQTDYIVDARQMTHYLETVFRKYLDDEHLANNCLTVLTDDTDTLLSEFSDGIAKWKLVHRRTEQDDEICVFSVGEFKGLESDMVIYIHGPNASENEKYIAYTRAKYYLIELVRNY